MQIIYLIKNLHPEYLKNSYNSTVKQQTSQLKMAKNLNGHSSKKEIYILNEHTERQLTSLAIGKCK